MSRPTELTIDLAALKYNLTRVHDFAPKSKVIAMVKANAYGHGLERVAKALKSADAFGVASMEEGIVLRRAGITQPIVLMEGLFYVDEIKEASEHHFTLVVHHKSHVQMLQKFDTPNTFNVWLKIDTGMHRLGFAPHEAKKIYEMLNAIPAVKKPIGLMTHFAAADEVDEVYTQEQIKVFDEVTLGLPGPRSLANSSAIIAWPNAHADWVRPGLMLYGVSPLQKISAAKLNLQPVMTLSSRLIDVREVKKGDRIGYNGVGVAPQNMKIGVVGVGYGDGYPQFAPNGTPVLIRNTLCPIIGRVSMDMLTIDLRNINTPEENEKVILWGDGLPIETIATYSHTSAYELLTRMTPRPKIVLKE